MTELKVLGVVLDTKLSFEIHLSPISVSMLYKLEIIKKDLCLFVDLILVLRCSLELFASSVRVLLPSLDACCYSSSSSFS